MWVGCPIDLPTTGSHGGLSVFLLGVPHYKERPLGHHFCSACGLVATDSYFYLGCDVKITSLML